MSEKYSTDELVKSIEETYLERMDLFERFIGGYLQRNTQYDRRDAIIARLRAADTLYEAANPIVGEISNFADNDLTEYQVIRFKDLVRLRKAIAEYEGKEG